jgi:hypothetical protein
MPKASPFLQTFDGGELSPLLGARTDLAKYFNGCAALENFIPTVQGPLIRRGGTQFINAKKLPASRGWLIRFQVSERVSYMLEFGAQYIRFYTNRGLLTASGTPVEVATPYTSADLLNEDGTCAIRVVQSADVMYIFHRRVPPQKLTRVSATAFTLQAVQLTGGPFEDVNTNGAVTITSSGQTGTVTLTASSAGVFSAALTGDLIYLEVPDLAVVRPWAVYQEVAVGDRRRVDDRVYICTAVGAAISGNDPNDASEKPVTGVNTPIHTEGRAWDGDGIDVPNDQRGPIGVQWEFQHAGYGIARLNTYLTATTMSATVIGALPEELVGVPTHKWARSLFSDANGWPEHGAFWRERLVLVAGRRIAMSVPGDFENFNARESGETQADSSIVQTLNARQINRVVWAVESRELVLGTDGDEWIVGPIQDAQAVGPANIRAERRTTYGSRAIQPAEVGGKVLFVQSSGRRVRDYVYDYNTDNYASSDTTKLATHILESGVIDLTYQQEPDSVVWMARADGLLVGCTYDQEPGRSDVYAWHPHPMVNGWVESVEVMPAPDGSEDDLWMIVRRVINGQTVRYIELLRKPLRDIEPQAEAFYVDCGLTYRGAPADEISGLGHLEGQTVQILADGAAHPDLVVAGGKVTLQVEAAIIHVGLSAPCAMCTMGLEAGATNGSAQAKLKKLTNVAVRMHRSLGGNLGPARANVETLNFRRPSQPMNAPPALFSGDMIVPWRGGFERDARIWYTNEQPLPVVLLGLLPMVSTIDDR